MKYGPQPSIVPEKLEQARREVPACLRGKRFIFALDLKRAEWLANKLDFGARGDWFYIRDVSQLRGIHNATLLVFGDYWCSPRWEEVNDTAQILGWTILKIKD